MQHLQEEAGHQLCAPGGLKVALAVAEDDAKRIEDLLAALSVSDSDSRKKGAKEDFNTWYTLHKLRTEGLQPAAKSLDLQNKGEREGGRDGGTVIV